MNSRRVIIRACLFSIAAIVGLIVVAMTYLAITAAPGRGFTGDQPLGQSLGHNMPSDSKLRAMVRRAQLDYIINPLPDVGRTLLYLNEVRSDGSMFEFVFDPEGKLDVFVIYRFSSDGKMLWKYAGS